MAEAAGSPELAALPSDRRPAVYDRTDGDVLIRSAASVSPVPQETTQTSCDDDEDDDSSSTRHRPKLAVAPLRFRGAGSGCDVT